MDLKLSELLSPEAVILSLKAKSKMSAIKEIAKHLVKKGVVINSKQFLKAIDNRENLESTGIGNGVAIPHAKTDAVKELILTVAMSKNGVDFNSVDGEPSHVIFMIVSPDSKKGDYIRTLAKLSRLVRKMRLKNLLLKAKTVEDVLNIIKDSE